MSTCFEPSAGACDVHGLDDVEEVDSSSTGSSFVQVATCEAADTSMEHCPQASVLRQWQTAKTELEDIDRVLNELRAELRQFEVRREVVAKREVQLRHAAVTLPSLQTPNRKTDEFQVMTPRVEGMSEAATGVGAQAGQSCENRDANAEDSPRMAPAKSGPTEHRLSAGPGSPERAISSQPGTPTLSPRESEDAAQDWERGLESFGVAKCGVCGMKLPLDVAEIEQHSLECEAALKEGRRPARPDATSLRTMLATVGEYPSNEFVRQEERDPKVATLGDRAASLRSRMARRRSKSTSAVAQTRSLSRWRSALLMSSG